MLTEPSKYSLSDLAERFQLELHGEASHLVDSVGTLRSATPTQVSFLANPAYRSELESSRAGVIIVKPEDAKTCPGNYFIASDPYLAYARLAKIFDVFHRADPGVHPTAFVAPDARLGSDVSIGPKAVIGPNCQIGDGSVVGAGTIIEAEARLGRQCRLYSNVSIGQKVTLGDRVVVHPGVVIGGDGFGIAFAVDHWEKVPQLGGVRIGDDCEIGANSTIDRGAIDDTVLEEDVRVDNLVQIAHNVHIGAHTAIAAQVGIAGSTTIGRYCMFGGQAGVNGHISVADRVNISARSTIYHSIEKAGGTWSSMFPSLPLKEWQRGVKRLRELDDLARRVDALEESPENSRDKTQGKKKT